MLSMNSGGSRHDRVEDDGDDDHTASSSLQQDGPVVVMPQPKKTMFQSKSVGDAPARPLPRRARRASLRKKTPALERELKKLELEFSNDTTTADEDRNDKSLFKRNSRAPAKSATTTTGDAAKPSRSGGGFKKLFRGGKKKNAVASSTTTTTTDNLSSTATPRTSSVEDGGGASPSANARGAAEPQSQSLHVHTGIPMLRQLYLDQEQQNDRQLYMSPMPTAGGSTNPGKGGRKPGEPEVVCGTAPLDAALTSFVLDGL